MSDMSQSAKVDKLTELLGRLNGAQDPAAVKAEAREFLAQLGPEELSMAEQKLVEAGLDPAELRHLCQVHMEMLGEELERMREQVPPGHVVHTLVSEHDAILEFLDELEQLNDRIGEMSEFEAGREEFDRLHHIAEHLVETESHHDREERVLFPELEQRGVTGPPRIMRLEHEQLWPQKVNLKELAESADEMDFEEFKRRLDITVRFIVPTLREHIFKENNILYPTAVQLVEEEEVWERMKEESDEMGYCCFTPEK